MKTTNKIVAMILAIVLLISMLPIVSNAATITINESSSSTGSSTYEVYKILNKTENGYELTTNAKNYFETNVTVKIDGGEEKYLTSVDEVLEYLTDLASGETASDTNVTYSPETIDEFASDYRNKVTVDNADVKNGESPIDVNGDGYYLIYDKDGDPRSQNILVEVVDGSATVNLKAEGVTVEKEATNGDSYYVGDTVEFTITTAVPNMSGYDSYTFTITDTPTNLDITEGTVKVYIGDDEVTEDEDVTVNIIDNVLTIELGNYLYANKDNLIIGTEIKVIYDAVLTADAVEGSTATNDVEIVYSNDPNTDSTGTTETTETTTETVYTYSVTFNKKSTLGKDLTGAEFVVKDSEGKYLKVDEETGAITLVDSQDDATVYEGGSFTVKGLKEGTYELVEIQAPDGYSIVGGLEFTISNTDDGGEATAVTHSLSESSDYLEVVTDSGLDGFEVNVINSKTTILPSTGGIGTTIFTVVGIVLMAGAVIALVVINKRKNSK